jgi:hypothetical protein
MIHRLTNRYRSEGGVFTFEPPFHGAYDLCQKRALDSDTEYLIKVVDGDPWILAHIGSESRHPAKTAVALF